MKLKRLVFVPMLLVFSVANASQFASVIDAIAIKSSADYTNSEWKDTEKIKGIKWQWPHYESGAHHSTMKGKTRVGKDKSPYVGSANVLIEGARTMISTVNISVANKRVDMGLLGPGQAKRIRTTCDFDDASFVVNFYEFQKPGYKPLYVKYEESWGASGESGSVDFTIAYRLGDIIPSKDCSVKKQ